MFEELNNLDELKKLKYVFVVNTFGPFGGAERQALILANFLSINVTQNILFLAFEDGMVFKQKILDIGIECVLFPFEHNGSKIKKVIQYYKLIKFLKAYKPDVLIPYVAESNKIIAQVWKYTDAKFAFWNQREEGRKLYGTVRENKLIRNVSAIVSNSIEGKKALRKIYGLDEQQVTVINNGVVPCLDAIEAHDWHKKFKIEADRPLVSMIANITERKDHETLIRAWAIVVNNCKSQNKKIPFLILAGRKAKTYDSLRLLAFDHKLSDHIGFTGVLEKVQVVIKPSLFCVFSSNLEGCPNGVLECMEQGKAVVGTQIDGIKQALGEEFDEHVFVPMNSPKVFAEKIQKLLYDSELRIKIENYNRTRIVNSFSVEKMVISHLKIIENSILK